MKSRTIWAASSIETGQSQTASRPQDIVTRKPPLCRAFYKLTNCFPFSPHLNEFTHVESEDGYQERLKKTKKKDGFKKKQTASISAKQSPYRLQEIYELPRERPVISQLMPTFLSLSILPSYTGTVYINNHQKQGRISSYL